MRVMQFLFSYLHNAGYVHMIACAHQWFSGPMHSTVSYYQLASVSYINYLISVT